MKFFHEVSLPDFISIYARGGPHFQTMIVSTITGREARSTPRSHALQQYEVKDCKLNSEQFMQINAFFRARQGMMYGFKMRDPADYTVDNQKIAVGDGKQAQFQLSKSYRDDLLTYSRAIHKPIVSSILLKVDGNIADFTCNPISGIITLLSPPAQGAVITASFAFEVPVRFAVDSLTYHLDEDGSIIVDAFKLLEVLI